MFRLAGYQQDAQYVADAIASVLKVEVEVIDSQLVRVAGTGSLRNDVGARLLRGFVNKHVLNTGKPVFISEPGFHGICGDCPLTGKCFYLASIVYPIHADHEVVGTISLIAFSLEQRDTLVQNNSSHMEFIGRLADLFGSRVKEREATAERVIMANHLEAVLDAIHEGLLAVDQEGVITHINKSAEKIFRLPKERALGRELRAVMTGVPLMEVIRDKKGFSSRELFVNVSGRRLHLLSTARPIPGEGGAIGGAAASFRDFTEAQKLAYEYISAQQSMTFDDIIGVSQAIKSVKARAEKVAGSNSTVLILGETGTGKEIFARAIHAESPYGNKPFVAINCGAIPESLLESELFGYEEGAFTGARRGGKPGKFELANGGTLFLDEIGNMSLYLQAKLLRVLQERQIERVGGTNLIPVDIRIIAATHADLLTLVQKGSFREDLYYRISVIPLLLPSLRERKEDIPLLMGFYMKRFASLLGKDIRGFSDQVMELCINYSWPGNVRELVNVVEYAVNMGEEMLVQVDSLPQRLREKQGAGINGANAAGAANAAAAVPGPGDGIVPLEELEKDLLFRALAKFGWGDEGKKRAAHALGISRATVYRKIEKYNLKPPVGGG